MRAELEGYLLLGDAVIITNIEHEIVAVNDAYETVTGYDKKQIIGRRAGILRSNLTPKSTYDRMKRALNRGVPWSGVFVNRTRSGELWHSSITITPVAVDNETYYVGVFRNLNHLSDGSYISEKRKSKLQNEIMRILAFSCEIRDPAIEGHLVRVQRLTRKLIDRLRESQSFRISEDYARHLINASILHDIGKSGIPEGILYKPGGLTRYERLIMETHPLIGIDILDKITKSVDDDLLLEEFKIARNIIESHHEKWDGTGYPNRLAGDDIPIEARIVAVVDVYDALTSRRAYKEAWPHERAIEYLESQRGLAFDPRLVDAFVEADLPE